MEDPFFVVKDEVQKTIVTSDVLFQRWCDLVENGAVDMCREEYDWTTNELRNCLRSIEWDLEDLEETISIVEKNPRRFKIDAAELNGRRLFIQQTRNSVKGVRDRMASPNSKPSSKSSHSTPSSISHMTSANNGPDKPQNKYTRLENEPESTEHLIVSNRLIEDSNGVNPSVLTLHDSSPQPNTDQDEQSIMLGGDMHLLETVETVRVRNAFKRVMRLLHLDRDWKQLTAITIMLVIVAIVILLFILL